MNRMLKTFIVYGLSFLFLSTAFHVEPYHQDHQDVGVQQAKEKVVDRRAKDVNPGTVLLDILIENVVFELLPDNK